MGIMRRVAALVVVCARAREGEGDRVTSRMRERIRIEERGRTVWGSATTGEHSSYAPARREGALAVWASLT